MSSENSNQKAREAFLAANAAKSSNVAKSIWKDIPALHKAIVSGDRTALARGITLVESNKDEDQKLAEQLISLCIPAAGKALRVAITGVPGVGKSSFIEALGFILAEQGKKLAVLAIDPSSEISKGSILGDKTRMEKLSAHKNAFIRPSPTSGSLGGVTGNTRESMLIYEAAGFDIIFIETVGVGQSETAAHNMVDCFMLLLLPGAGDELQGIKRGIVEMADLLVVNKADMQPDRAKESAREYTRALHLFPPHESGWIPPVLSCSAITKAGINEVWAKVLEHKLQMEQSGQLTKRRNQQASEWLIHRLNQALTRSFYKNPEVQSKLGELKTKVESGTMHPIEAAKILLAKYN